MQTNKTPDLALLMSSSETKITIHSTIIKPNMKLTIKQLFKI